jgi:hypothetical protein
VAADKRIAELEAEVGTVAAVEREACAQLLEKRAEMHERLSKTLDHEAQVKLSFYIEEARAAARDIRARGRGRDG